MPSNHTLSTGHQNDATLLQRMDNNKITMATMQTQKTKKILNAQRLQSDLWQMYFLWKRREKMFAHDLSEFPYETIHS